MIDAADGKAVDQEERTSNKHGEEQVTTSQLREIAGATLARLQVVLRGARSHAFGYTRHALLALALAALFSHFLAKR